MLAFCGSAQIMSASSQSRPGGTVKVIGAAACTPSAGTGWLAGGALTGSVTTWPI
jgi:hypothetical protein